MRFKTIFARETYKKNENKIDVFLFFITFVCFAGKNLEF